MIEFNMNNYIHVKLTDTGRNELKRQHIEFLGNNWPYIPPEEDSEGYSKWQMWDIMNKLGELLANGVEPAFLPIIKIETYKEI